jgi:YVTN family beta-propeller protein
MPDSLRARLLLRSPLRSLLPAAVAVAFAGLAGAAHALDKPVFVLNSLDASVSVVDAKTFTEVKRIPTGKEPHHLYLTPDEKSLLVANALSDSLLFIDPVTGNVQRTLTKIVDPYQLRFSPDMKWFATTANRLNHIDIYRWLPEQTDAPLQLVKRIPAGKVPSHLVIDSKSRFLIASLQDSDQLIAIDLATQAVKWTVPSGKMPADVFLTPDDKYLFVGLTGDEYVEVYDVSGAMPQKVKRIKTGAGAHAFRPKGDKRHIFVSNRVENTISLIDTQTMEVVANYPAPGGPDCMDLMNDGKTLLVTSRWARKLTVIDIDKKKVVQQVKVGRSPHGVWTLDHAPRQ